MLQGTNCPAFPSPTFTSTRTKLDTGRGCPSALTADQRGFVTSSPARKGLEHLFVRPSLDVLGSIVHASCPGGQGNLPVCQLIYKRLYY
jgi:hypothetical protein